MFSYLNLFLALVLSLSYIGCTGPIQSSALKSCDGPQEFKMIAERNIIKVSFTRNSKKGTVTVKDSECLFTDDDNTSLDKIISEKNNGEIDILCEGNTCDSLWNSYYKVSQKSDLKKVDISYFSVILSTPLECPRGTNYKEQVISESTQIKDENGKLMELGWSNREKCEECIYEGEPGQISFCVDGYGSSGSPDDGSYGGSPDDSKVITYGKCRNIWYIGEPYSCNDIILNEVIPDGGEDDTFTD